MKNKVILYTTHCSRCNTLETELKEAGVEFEICDDIHVIIEKGIMTVPLLEVDGDVMDYSQARWWLHKIYLKLK